MPNKLGLISNYPTADALAIVDGGMDERGGCDPGTIELLQSMSRQGKLLQYHPQDAGPKREGLFNTRLACFLAGAGPYSYGDFDIVLDVQFLPLSPAITPPHTRRVTCPTKCPR